MGKYEHGECVAIDGYVATGRFGENDLVGIVLESELVEMDQDLFEWLYTISTEQGIEQYWPQEIKPVNFTNKEYNVSITHKKRKNNGSKQSK
tara:strand:- start:614 stop:889 length:276 start_codon:yes stop_codon:yes gene_type:complete